MRSRFDRRGQHLPPELRPDWMVAVVLLAIDACWGGRAGLPQLHALVWAARSRENFDQFVAAYAADTPQRSIWRRMGIRFDPAVDQAVTRASIRGLVARQSNGSITIADSGREHLGELLDASLMSDVVDLLNELPQPITQSRVEALLPTTTDVAGVSL